MGEVFHILPHSVAHINLKAVWRHASLWPSLVSLLTLVGYPLPSERDLEPTLPIRGGPINNYGTERGDLRRIKRAALRLLKHICQLLNLTQIQGSLVMKRGRWGVTHPLAFVNCVSHVVLAGTVNWKRSRGFAVLMSFPWTQVILWIPEEPWLSPHILWPSC